MLVFSIGTVSNETEVVPMETDTSVEDSNYQCILL